MLPEPAVPWHTLEETQQQRQVNTSQLIYLISVTDEESLLIRGYLHRDDDCMTWIYHSITRFGPQGLASINVQRLDL